MTPIGTDDAWDAERTHDWLLGTFRSWVESKINQKRPLDRTWALFRKQSASAPFELSIRSAATYERRDLQSARSASELCELCTFFQGHYHLNLSDLPVDPAMTKNVIRLVHHFRRFIDENDRSFIASNLAIKGTNLQEEMTALLSNTQRPFI
jgi:hypothetical protein